MSDAPVNVRAKRSKSAAAKRLNDADAEEFLIAEIEASLERSGKKLQKLNADMDALLRRLSEPLRTS